MHLMCIFFSFLYVRQLKIKLFLLIYNKNYVKLLLLLLFEMKHFKTDEVCFHADTEYTVRLSILETNNYTALNIHCQELFTPDIFFCNSHY